MDTGADSIRFAGLMSRCITPAEWQYFSAFISYEDKNSTAHRVSSKLTAIQASCQQLPVKYHTLLTEARAAEPVISASLNTKV